MTKHFLLPLTVLSLGLAFSTSGCTPTVSKRGNMVQDQQVQQIVPGVHAKLDVLKIMGSPTTQAPFDDNLWYYIGQETEKRGIFDPKVTQERIVVVQFNAEDGLVQSIKDADAERINIPIERDKTKTQGHEVTLPQQLLGNLGRFNQPSGN